MLWSRVASGKFFERFSPFHTVLCYTEFAKTFWNDEFTKGPDYWSSQSLFYAFRFLNGWVSSRLKLPVTPAV